MEALEAAVLPALCRPPCLVVFSGGRDSSAVPAVARRSGLPDPMPATNRFRGSPATKETEWQELVVRHLGLTDWHVLDRDDELDVIGPVAEQVLRNPDTTARTMASNTIEGTVEDESFALLSASNLVSNFLPVSTSAAMPALPMT